MQPVDAAHIAALEPLLAGRFARGLLLPQEGQLANDQLYAALATALDADLAACGGSWHEGLAIERVERAALVDAHGTRHGFDLAVDCRGIGSRAELPGLHGVRGEVLTVFAPGISLRRPVRLIHPRYALYVAPRPGGQFIVGATELDSEDAGPPTLRSTLELGSALYSLHPEFGEARVLRLAAALRPALPDHQPLAGQGADGVWRINGLFRHGYLIAPAMVQQLAVDIAAALGAPGIGPGDAAGHGAQGMPPKPHTLAMPAQPTQPQAA
jgi:glycine oxidase